MLIVLFLDLIFVFLSLNQQGLKKLIMLIQITHVQLGIQFEVICISHSAVLSQGPQKTIVVLQLEPYILLGKLFYVMQISSSTRNNI